MTMKHTNENAEDEIREAFKVFDGVSSIVNIKGTVSLFQVTLQAKIPMSDSQRYT